MQAGANRMPPRTRGTKVRFSQHQRRTRPLDSDDVPPHEPTRRFEAMIHLAAIAINSR